MSFNVIFFHLELFSIHCMIKLILELQANLLLKEEITKN